MVSIEKMVEPTCELMHWWQQTGKIISTLRMDNAGKNKRLTSRLASADWKSPVVIKYTARDNPQQNSQVKVAFMPSLIRHVQQCTTQTYLWTCSTGCLVKLLLQ